MDGSYWLMLYGRGVGSQVVPQGAQSNPVGAVMNNVWFLVHWVLSA